jgi:flavin reductase (DIM6/NTAB) family NADH-FMN oxidoreductase RutF
MNIPVSSLPAERDAYKLLTASVVPRPIAWVLSQNPDGVLNLAPFSFFQVVCADPPTIIVAASRRASGEWKDTVLNAQAGGEFVVNIVSIDLGEQMNHTATTYPHGVSELEKIDLTTAPSNLVKVPRVAEAPIALECRLAQSVPVGHGRGQHMVLFGEVVSFYIRDDLYDERSGRVDIPNLRPIGRLAGNLYSKPGEIFEMIKPS